MTTTTTPPLTGQIALVAGATRGAGRGIARALAAGGAAIAVRVDHTVESEVKGLIDRIESEQGRLDVLVDSVAGEDPMMRQWGSFWTTDLTNADALLRQAV